MQLLQQLDPGLVDLDRREGADAEEVERALRRDAHGVQRERRGHERHDECGGERGMEAESARGRLLLEAAQVLAQRPAVARGRLPALLVQETIVHGSGSF